MSPPSLSSWKTFRRPTRAPELRSLFYSSSGSRRRQTATSLPSSRRRILLCTLSLGRIRWTSGSIQGLLPRSLEGRGRQLCPLRTNLRRMKSMKRKTLLALEPCRVRALTMPLASVTTTKTSLLVGTNRRSMERN